MTSVLDPVTVINFVLCVVILGLGISVYSRKKDTAALYIGAAFGLFAVSHLTTLLGLSEAFTGTLIAIRTVAYLTVILALFKHWKT
jgi:hypothetical protein